MRMVFLIGVGLFITLAARAQTPSLKEARDSWLHGHYRQAAEAYERLLTAPATHDDAALGLSKVLESQGKYDKALHSAERAFKQSPKNPGLCARCAELLYRQGQWDRAEKLAETALKLKDDCFLARWVQAQIYRDRGDVEKANAALRWFIRTYSSRSDQDKDIHDPEELVLVGLAGSENARWHHLADQFEFILTDVYGDALKSDKSFWPAEYQAGMLLLEKYNSGEALAAFEKALTINPRAAEALVGMGLTALQRLEYRHGQQFAERALRINPNLPAALQLRADIDLATTSIPQALKELHHARRINPRDEDTLGRLAACAYLQHHPNDLAELAQTVTAFDPKPGHFYFVLARAIEDHHRFDDAEKYYKKAIELRPLVPGAQNNLGLLYMRMGREKEATDVLTKAFAADPFNVRVSNSLKVLRHLEKYQTVQTPHFAIRFDPKNDAVLARYLTTYLEETYEKLAHRFGYRPKGPILIEVFNSHAMFSGRIVALPDLFTIGASTGKMFAMVSPHGKQIQHPFNWARVLRHELTHVFNLEQTDFQVPHWFTEGLAVMSEDFPRPQEWNTLLLERIPEARPVPIKELDNGFIRPHSMEERAFAYCESQLYIQYLTSRYGPATVQSMLAAYKDGLDTPAALQRVCHVEVPTLESDFRHYLEAKIVPSISKRKISKPLSFTDLRRAYEQHPADNDIAARLAKALLDRGNAGEARKLAEAVLQRQPKNATAACVKAKLLQAGGDDSAALHLLQSVLDQKAPDIQVVTALGKLYAEGHDFARAGKMYELAHQSEPYERQWLVALARIYTLAGNTDRLVRTLKELIPLDADDLDSRKRLADLLEHEGDHKQAEKYARQSLEIDVVNAKVQHVLGDALRGQKKWTAAIEAYQQALAVDAQDDDARLGLARAYIGAGQREQAGRQVQQILLHDPDNEAARRLRDRLNR